MVVLVVAAVTVVGGSRASLIWQWMEFAPVRASLLAAARPDNHLHLLLLLQLDLDTLLCTKHDY